MSIAALVVLASTPFAAGPVLPSARGVVLASAGARAEIVRPAIVRQGVGWQDTDPDAPRPQVIRRDGTVSIEFE